MLHSVDPKMGEAMSNDTNEDEASSAYPDHSSSKTPQMKTNEPSILLTMYVEKSVWTNNKRLKGKITKKAYPYL